MLFCVSMYANACVANNQSLTHEDRVLSIYGRASHATPTLWERVIRPGLNMAEAVMPSNPQQLSI